MEDESGLELSLGLSFGGSSPKFKGKDEPSDPKGDEGSDVNISDDSFKNIFKSGLQNQEPNGKQKSDLVAQSHENFFTDLVKCPKSMADCSNDSRNNPSQLARNREQMISSNKTVGAEEEGSGSGKRKLSFEEINFQNKHGAKKSSGASLPRNSPLSNTTEDGSTGENEDVAESEAEGPQPWLVLHREEETKCSDALKFNGKSVLTESSAIGQKEHTFGIPLSPQPVKAMNVPYPVPAAVSSTGSGSNAADFPSKCGMPLMPMANGERPVASVAITNSLQLAFGYPSAQLPTLETGSSWAFNSQPLHLSSLTSRGQSTEVQIQEQFGDASQGAAAAHNTTADPSYDGNTSDFGLPARPEDQGNSGNNTTQANEPMNKPDAIRPGIAPNLRFGGCGSCPDLPWVTTIGQGQNGKIISGVTYKYDQDQIKIVCACHGTHMSPEEFVQHASSEVLNLENSPPILPSFTPANTTNSAQS